METLSQEQEVETVVAEAEEVKIVPAKLGPSFIQGEIEKFSIQKNILAKYNGYAELTIGGVDDREGYLVLSKSRKEVKTKRLDITKQKTLLTSELKAGVKTINEFADGITKNLKVIEANLQEKEDEYTDLKEAEKRRIHLEKKAVGKARVQEIESFKGTLTLDFAMAMPEKEYSSFRDMIKQGYEAKLRVEQEEEARRKEREAQAIQEAKDKAEKERVEAIEKAKEEREAKEKAEAQLAELRAERKIEEDKILKLAKEAEERKAKEKAESDRIIADRKAEAEKVAEIARMEQEKAKVELAKIKAEQAAEEAKIAARKKAEQEEAERIAKEKKNAKAKAAAEKLSKARIKNLKTDKVALEIFAENLKNIPIPDVKTKEGKDLVAKAKTIAAQEGILIMEILNEI